MPSTSASRSQESSPPASSCDLQRNDLRKTGTALIADIQPAASSRRLSTGADEPFFRSLFRQTAPDLSTLPQETQDLLLSLQYRGRAITWSSNFPHAEHWVLLTGEQEPAGRIVLAETPSALRCVDLAVLPRCGGRGIATAALQQAQERAQAAGQTLALRVAKHSPALHLYLRLGFKPASEDDLAFEMSWDGAPFA